MNGGWCLSILLACLLTGCASVWPFVPPTATPTPTPTPTDTPTPTVVPTTATFTPVPTRTPIPDSWAADSLPTPTWTPVPGNPRWSWWSYEGVAFLLPVAWQKAAQDPPAGRRFRAPGGSEQPQLLVEVEPVATDTPVSTYAGLKLQAVRASFSTFELLDSAPIAMAGGQAQRVLFAGALPGEGGTERNVQGLAFYFVQDGTAVSLRFWVADRLFDEWVDTFERIAASLEWPRRWNVNP